MERVEGGEGGEGEGGVVQGGWVGEEDGNGR